MTNWLVPLRCGWCDKPVKKSKRRDFHDSCYKKAVKRGRRSILKRSK